MIIRVLIAEDYPVVREGIRSFVEIDTELEVVGEAINGQQAVEMAHRLQPDVILMDIGMPILDGLSATSQIRQELPGIKILVLTGSADVYTVNQALRAGADGCMLKNVEAEELCQTIKLMAHNVSGSRLLSNSVVNILLNQTIDNTPQPPTKEEAQASLSEVNNQSNVEKFTNRELEILRLMAQGKANKEIANILKVGEKTVKTHVSIILAKLNARSRTQAAMYAVNNGLVKLTSEK